MMTHSELTNPENCIWVCLAQTTQGGTMPVSVWTSTLTRTIETAEQIPFPKLRWKVWHPSSLPSIQLVLQAIRHCSHEL